MVKVIVLTVFLISPMLFAKEHKEPKHLSYDTSLSLLKSIHKDAIVMGSGEKLVYVFLDPLCEHSRKFMSLVTKNPKMLTKYQYSIFFYAIPKLKSTDVISAIYMSKDPKETLLQIMVEGSKQSTKSNQNIKAKVERITKIAKDLNVRKRPYIFIQREQ